MILTTALVAVAVLLAVWSVLLLSRANRGQRLVLDSAAGMRMPLSVYATFLGALALVIVAARVDAGEDGAALEGALAPLVLLIVVVQFVGRIWHNRRLVNRRNDER